MATETTEAAGAAPGMPQLDFTTFPNQIFWLVVTLVVIYMVLSRVALPRIASVLAERQGTITNDIAAAEELKERAAEAEAAYDKALADARAEAGRIGAETKAEVQAEIVEGLRLAFPAVGIRFSEEKLPWRGTLVDPSMDYDSGEAILLVEEPDVPNHMRQAALTENGSFVAGMKRYFDLVWEYESVAGI